MDEGDHAGTTGQLAAAVSQNEPQRSRARWSLVIDTHRNPLVVGPHMSPQYKVSAPTACQARPPCGPSLLVQLSDPVWYSVRGQRPESKD